MKRLYAIAFILFLAVSAYGQVTTSTARRVMASGSVPGSCVYSASADPVLVVSGTLYVCGVGNTYVAVGGGGSGSGTVTSVGLVGTANQLTVTGTSPITGSGSWTLSLPSTINVNAATASSVPWSGLTNPAAYPSGTTVINTGGNITNIGGQTPVNSYLWQSQYISGGSFTGSVGQRCAVSGFNGGGTALGWLTLTGPNAVASGTPINVRWDTDNVPTYTPQGGFTSAPTSAGVGSDTAVCSGTIVLASFLSGLPSQFQIHSFAQVGSVNPPPLLGTSAAGSGSLGVGVHRWCVTALNDNFQRVGTPVTGESICGNILTTTVSDQSTQGKQNIYFVPPVMPGIRGGVDTDWGNYPLTYDMRLYRDDGSGFKRVALIPAIGYGGASVFTSGVLTDDGVAAPGSPPPVIDTSNQLSCVPFMSPSNQNAGGCEITAAGIALDANIGVYVQGGMGIQNFPYEDEANQLPLSMNGPGWTAGAGFDLHDVTSTGGTHPCIGAVSRCWGIYVPNSESTIVVPSSCPAGQSVISVSVNGVLGCSNGAGQLTFSVPITNAQLLAFDGTSSTNVEIVPASSVGSGSFFVIDNATFQHVCSGCTAFSATTSGLQLYYGDHNEENGTDGASALLMHGVLDVNVSAFTVALGPSSTFADYGSFSIPMTDANGAAVKCNNAGPQFTTGTGSGYLTVVGHLQVIH